MTCVAIVGSIHAHFIIFPVYIRLRRKRQNGSSHGHGPGSSSHHEENIAEQDAAEVEVNMLTEVRYLSLLIPMLIVWSFTSCFLFALYWFTAGI